jgi:hypothetical protein
MKQGSKYKIVRVLFGLYLVWVGIVNIYRIEEYDKSVKSSITNFESIFSLEGIVDFLSLNEYVPRESLKNIDFNFNSIRNCSTEIVYLMNLCLIIGGLLGAFGYSVSFSFAFLGILLNIIFIHNFFYFRDEKMKVNVLKMISLMGGIFFMA